MWNDMISLIQEVVKDILGETKRDGASKTEVDCRTKKSTQ